MRALFRPARPSSSSWNVVKTAIQIVAFWGSLLWLVPAGITRVEDRLGVGGFQEQAALGWLVLVSASVLGLWSGWTMAVRGRGTPLPVDTAAALVTSGPYRCVRNPMAVAGLAQGLGVSLIVGSWGVGLYVVTGGLLWHFIVRPLEERDLLVRFGAEYEGYRRRVGLWWPTRRKLSGPRT